MLKETLHYTQIFYFEKKNCRGIPVDTNKNVSQGKAVQSSK